MNTNEKIVAVATLGYALTCVVEAVIDRRETRKRQKERERLIKEAEELNKRTMEHIVEQSNKLSYELTFDLDPFIEELDRRNEETKQVVEAKKEVLNNEFNEAIFDDLRKELDDMRRRCNNLENRKWAC